MYAPGTVENKRQPGFTLVEIMVVVVVIGLLAAMAIPAFKKARINSIANRLANDLRIFSGAFETHALESGNWAPDGMGNVLDPEVAPYLEGTGWDKVAPNGGTWDWEYNRLGYVAGIALLRGNDMPAVFLKVDTILDDGDLSTGRFIDAGDRYFYILE